MNGIHFALFQLILQNSPANNRLFSEQENTA